MAIWILMGYSAYSSMVQLTYARPLDRSFSNDSPLLPLVLVSYEELSREYPTVPVGLQMTFSVFAGRYPAAGRVIAMISGWLSDGQILVRVATRPVVANRVGSGSVTREVLAPQVGGQPRSATVGLPCRVGASTNLNAFITAGHLVGGLNSSVEVAGTDDSGQPKWLTGTVRYWSDPASNPPNGEWDYSVVVMDDGVSVDPLAHTGCQPAPTQPYVPFNVSLNGAVSRLRYGMIDGALSQHGDTARQWLNCWSLAPSYLMDLGDSGTVALGTPPGGPTVFGHFVGGQRWPGGKLVHLYVQDLASCLTARLGQVVTI
jgi:hypothetical protein